MFWGVSLIVVTIIPLLTGSLAAQPSVTMRLVAGDGTPGFSDSDPVRFDKPIRLAPYGDDAIVMADIYNHAIRIVTLDGRVKTIAGGPDKKGYKDGSASEAMFHSPHGVAFDPTTGEIVVAEAGNHTIRRLIPADPNLPLLERDYTVSTLAGVPGKSGYGDGPAGEALFKSPHALAYLPDGGIVVMDIGNARIRLIKDDEVRTVAGSGETGQADGSPLEASFHYPMDLVAAPDGSIFIADAGTHRIRRLVIGKEVSTLDLKSKLNTPHGIAVDEEGTVYVADMNAHRIVRIDKKGEVTQVCGTGKQGGKTEELNKPAAVLVHAGHLWIADLDNHQIKVLPLTQ
jgi:DNA-binding beta-propeller fold protein YncE